MSTWRPLLPATGRVVRVVGTMPDQRIQERAAADELRVLPRLGMLDHDSVAAVAHARPRVPPEAPSHLVGADGLTLVAEAEQVAIRRSGSRNRPRSPDMTAARNQSPVRGFAGSSLRSTWPVCARAESAVKTTTRSTDGSPGRTADAFVAASSAFGMTAWAGAERASATGPDVVGRWAGRSVRPIGAQAVVAGRRNQQSTRTGAPGFSDGSYCSVYRMRGRVYSRSVACTRPST